MDQAAFPSGTNGNSAHHCFAVDILEATHQPVIILEKDWRRIVYANPACVATTGYSIEEIKGRSLLALRSPRHNNAFYRHIWKSLEEKGHWFGEIWARRKNGEDFPSLHTINPIFDNELGRITHYVSMFSDITAIKRHQANIGQLAYHDALTGLPNRLMLIDRIEHALRTHIRDQKQLAILFLDLDGFKTVNDTLGHAVGDRLLQTVAECFQSILRQGDTVARLGGDEFVIMAESCRSRAGIARIAEKASGTLHRPLNIDGHNVEMGATIGIAIAPQDGKNADVILSAADAAMYRAKKVNKGGFCFFDEL